MSSNSSLNTKLLVSNNDDVYEEIAINKLDNDIDDARDHKSNENKIKDILHIKSLSKNISQFGLLEPILVTKKTNGRYSILAGRYRTLACLRLNWKKIPCIVRQTKDKGEGTAISISENKKRLDYDVNESIKANVLLFTTKGYTNEQIMYYAKKIHNFGSKGIPANFLDAMEACDYSPNYLYQIMQTLVYLDPTVLKVIEREKLSIEKRILLTNTKLRKHPKIAIILIKEIKGLKLAQARLKVAQEIQDLETGATKIVDGNTYIFDETKREKIDTKIMTVKHAPEYYLDIMENMHHGLYLGTGHRLTQGESTYEPPHVQYTEKHRTTIAKELTRQELLNLERNMEMMGDLLSSWLDIINEELKEREGVK